MPEGGGRDCREERPEARPGLGAQPPVAHASGHNPPSLRPCAPPSSPFSPFGSVLGREGPVQSSGHGHKHGVGTSPKALGRPLPCPQIQDVLPLLIPGCYMPHLCVGSKPPPPVLPGDSRVLLGAGEQGLVTVMTTAQLLGVSSPTSILVA